MATQANAIYGHQTENIRQDFRTQNGPTGAPNAKCLLHPVPRPRLPRLRAISIPIPSSATGSHSCQAFWMFSVLGARYSMIRLGRGGDRERGVTGAGPGTGVGI